MDRPRRTKLRTFENLEFVRLQAVIRRVRWRWRLKVLLRGIGLLVLAGLATLLLTTWGLDTFRYRPVATVVLSLLTYGALAYVAWRFIVRPLSRSVTDRDVALFIEERAPGLRAALLSAVEFGAPEDRPLLRDVSPRLVEKVVEQALASSRSIGHGRAVDRDGMRQMSGLVSLAALAVVATLLINPAFLRQGVPFLLRPWGAADAATPYSIAVSPGNAQVARGGDQLISASLAGFDAEAVEISVKIGASEFERFPMIGNLDTGAREFMLLRVAEDVEYIVEAEGVRSPLHRLEVIDIPYVDRIDMDLEYPAYSGLPMETIEDGGDIAALAGTTAQLRITPTVAIPGGRILVTPASEGGEPYEVELAPGDGILSGWLQISESATYRIEFENYDGAFVEASSRYVIDVLSDQPPVVSVDEPGRDGSATLVEEFYVEASAADDYGVAALELVWSLNGGDEATVILGARNRRETSGSHTFYLEEADLEPGDFIAYYARARDRGEGDDGAGQTTTSDIYFLEIRPFGRDFRQADSGGGGGMQGGGGQQQPSGLSKRQREIITATFNLRRDRDKLDAGQVAEDLELLAGLQEALAAQTREVSGQLSMMGQEDAMAGMQILQGAASSMDEAAEALGAADPDRALGPEQRALLQLQRFEALAREMSIAMGQGGGGGGGAGDMDDILSMLDLDTDEMQNQYESVQRQRQERADNEIDAALQRLNELARRQQQELERQQAQAGQPGAPGRGDSQRQAAEQAEELARQLEQLARRDSDPELQEAANRLRDAADAMRQSAAAGTSESGVADGARALSEMQSARRLLDKERDGRLDRDLEDAQSRVQQLQAEQERIQSQVEEMASEGTTGEQMQELLGRKDRLAGEIRDLEMQLDDMARASRDEQLQTSRGLQEAAEFIRDSKLSDKVRYSKGVVQERLGRFADNFERGIAEDLDRLGEMVDGAAGDRERSTDERLAEAVDDARDLVQRLESLEDRLREGQEGDASADGQRRLGERSDSSEPGASESQGQRGQQGQQGEQGEQGQEGEGQQGQQGQQGEQGQQQGAGSESGRLGGANSGPPGRRQLARELQQRIGDAEELREALEAEGVQTTDLDGVIGAMQDLDQEFLGTARGLDELRGEVIEELKLFEFWLRRLTDATDGRRPQLGRSDAVPEGYRALVEEYFRSLSRDGGSQR
jgi:hypothetical protein